MPSMPEGRLKLIDGHLRRAMDPDMEVDVEILDVNDEEARALLLSIDPLATLAMQQEQLQTRLLEMTPTVSPDLRAMWEQAAAGALAVSAQPPGGGMVDDGVMHYYVLIACRGDLHQRELLERLHAEGLDCEAKMG
jgi:hypothetical protein